MKDKKISFKKKNQKKRQLKISTLALIKAYSLKEWLVLIRNLNIQYPDREKDVHFRGEFLVIAADMALRISNIKKVNHNNPTEQDCRKLVNADIQLSDDNQNLIKMFGLGGVSLLASWQNRFHYNRSNMLARIHLLYQKFDSHLLSGIGISLKDIYIILLAIYSVYEIKRKVFIKIENLHNPSIESLTLEKIKAFFSYFSTTQSNYIQEAKKDKIYENCFGKFRYLTRYPIIELSENEYIIPVFDQLIDTISNNLYFILLEYFQTQGKDASKSYLDTFGNILENYVHILTKEVFGSEYIVPADKIVLNKKEYRCEFVVFHDENVLAIEVKKMHFKRDSIVDKDKKSIDEILERHLVKAFMQIENTFNYIQQKNLYGLIVIPDILIGFSTLMRYMKKEFVSRARFDDNIFICTLSWYEALMANSPNMIFNILEKTKNRGEHEGNDIILVMQSIELEGMAILEDNQMLQKIGNYILKSIETQGKTKI